MRVLFWGTPEFAAPALRALIFEGIADVVGVVTQPDKPRGRSRSELVPPVVKEIAQSEGLRVLQPEKPRGDEFIAALRELAPDISVVVAYGHILSDEVIALPPMGTINVHASLLPRLRGASPIRAAIREGLNETGVTIMEMVRELDAGPIIHQLRTPIGEDETYGELSMRLAELGALALLEALTLMSEGEAAPRPQDDSQATFAPKIIRDDARVDWTARAETAARTIRAFDPDPGAFTTRRGATVKLFGARVAEGRDSPGVVLRVDDRMTVACGEGAVSVSDVQPEGKRRMSVAEWARGRGIDAGDVLGS